MAGHDFAQRELRNRATGRVLDIGCSRRWVEECLPDGSTYIGLDYPVTGIAMYGARPDVFADASELPFRDECMGTVVLFETLEHLVRPTDAIAEIARVLAPGGSLLLTVPFIYPLHDEPYDFTRYTGHGLRRELERVGFEVAYIKPSMGSAETAGLIVSLSLAGMTMEAFRKRSLAMVLSPVTVAAIPVSNLIFWLLGKVLPSWGALPAGYHVVAEKAPRG